MNILPPQQCYWGPDHRAATVCITFDNLGEAVELERGTWSKDRLLGQHFSVTRVLPAILKMLDELGLSATFFVEGINSDLYPQALKEIVASGHEIGYHAWRHEEWYHLSYEEESSILKRGLQSMEALLSRPYGFRPPGGKLTASSLQLLRQLGFTYCSPVGTSAFVTDGLVILPFEWPLVDAYAYLPRFATMRESLGDAHEPLSPTSFRENVHSALRRTVGQRSYLTLLFHPFVEEKEEYFEVMYSTLKELRELVLAGVIWCTTCHEVAQWMLTAYPERGR